MTDRTHPVCVPTADAHCSICGDAATLAHVITIDATSGMAEVSHGGTTSRVALDLVDDVVVGDAVLVHMGFAIGRVDGSGTP